MKRILALVLALMMLIAVCAGCGTDSDSDLAYVQDKGELVIGYTVYEPMNYTDKDGNFVGFDTEFAEAVCKELGVEPKFQLIDWGMKVDEVQSKAIDCIWNGMTLDAEREANMNCTKPYIKNAQVVVMKKGSGYTDTASLAGKTVCAEIGSAGEVQIIGSEDAKADEGLAKAEYVGKAYQTDCLMEVKAGTAAAAVLDMTLANAMIGEGTDYAELEIVDRLGIENYGVAFRKGSDIRDEVNKIFDQFVKDGTMQALADKYGLELAD